MQAAREALHLRITSRTRLASEAGRDIEEIFDEQQTEIALAAKYGIDLKPQPSPAATTFEPKDDQP